MKLIIDKNKILKPFQIIQGVISSKTTLPILSNVFIKVKNKKIEFIVTDLEIGINYTLINDNIINEGNIVISAKKMLEIIRELPEKDIFIEEDENYVIISCDKSKFKLVKLESSEFPMLPEINKETKHIKIKESLLKDIIKKVIYAVCIDEIGSNLNGVCFVLKGENIELVATDGHRLTFIKEKLEEKYDINISIIVPLKVLQELLKLLENNDLDVQIDILENSIFFKFREILLISRLIEGEYINYKKYIPTDYDKKINIYLDNIIKAVRRVGILANEKTNQIIIDIDKEKIKLSANMLEVGESFEEFEIKENKETIKLAYNSKYLLDILKNIETKEVIFELKDSFSPTVIKPSDNRKYLCVLMPMRI